MRWLRRGSALAILMIGWVFIAWQNHFHVSAPMVFVCLGYLAVVATVYNLWRTGTAAVDSSEDMADSTWAKPVGALGELEREKRTLLKAIKEAEFDHQMGKLSQHDADEMIRGYRARAIEVIKQIDQRGLGAAGSVREQILREVRARIQLDGKSPKKVGAKGARAGAGGGKRAEPEAAGREPSAAAAAGNGAVPPTRDTSDSISTSASSTQAANAVEVPSDDELDADSTTAIEPRREEPAKEATP